MAKTVEMKASLRKLTGTRRVSRMRNSSEIPGVIYGKHGTMPIQFASAEVISLLAKSTGGNVLVDLELSGGEKPQHKLALVQEIQIHPIKDRVLHIDLHEIAKDEVLHAEVLVTSVGEPIGAKSGGILEALLRHIKVSCLPKNLPEHIEIDVTNLDIGQSVHIGDIKAPEGVTILNPKDLAVFIVLAPTKEEEPTAAAAAAPTEPEVIKEKKTEETAEAAGDAKKGDAKKPEGKGDAKGGKH